MKKHLIVIGIVVLLLSVGLSGCNEPDDDKPQLGDVECRGVDKYVFGDYYSSKGSWYLVEENCRECGYVPQPDIRVSNHQGVTDFIDFDYCYVVDIQLKNYGDASDTVRFTVEVMQGDDAINSWTQSEYVSLIPTEVKSLRFFFYQVEYNIFGSEEIKYRWWFD